MAQKHPGGRPPIAPETRSIVGSLRLTAAEWAKFRALGGIAWLRERIARAKIRP